MSNQKIKKIKISELIPDANNANLGTERGRAMLEKSIQELGFGRSLVLDKHGRIIAGNKSHEVAGAVGLDNVLVIETDGTQIIAVQRTDLDLLEDDKAKLLAIADNRTAEISLNWNSDIVLDLSDEIDLGGFFTNDELLSLKLNPEEEGRGGGGGESGDDDEIPEAVESRVAPGDIWQLGRHFICAADCTVEENVRKLLSFVGGRSPDMVWADVPYGMNLDTDYSTMPAAENEKSWKGGRKYANVIGDDEDYDARPLLSMFAKVPEIFLWGADYYAERIQDKNNGSWFVWDKRVTESFDKMYGSCFELCWSKKKHKREIIRITWAGVFGTEQEFDKKRHHPTQKPLSLAQWFFEKYSEEKDLIFDPYMGSGMSLLAAEKMEGDRTVVGFELSENYCEVICQRFSNLGGIAPIKVGNVNAKSTGAEYLPGELCDNLPENLGF